jgi:ribosomal protein S4
MKILPIKILQRAGATVSLSQGRRLVAMGAVRINGELQEDMSCEVEINVGDKVHVGKGSFKITEELLREVS